MSARAREMIERAGRDAYEKALGGAWLRLKADARFVGLDKIRGPIAKVAALRAIGDAEMPCALLKRKKVIEHGMAEALEQLLDAATTAARDRLEG